MTQYYLDGEAAQIDFGRALAKRLHGRSALVFLRGDLGAGKTTLVRGLLRGLGHDGHVRSPTYTLIEPYEANGLQVYHLDLYRIADPDELDYLGLRELLGGEGLVLIEWPERGADVLPEPDLDILIEHAPPGRRITVQAIKACADLFPGAADDPPPAPE
ncbi:MAG: tRNA (adenosine(37)-N6)-threonylcarbamoyltransferase complex ATPase subunit type 1 TsaE [Thiohalocapsa sp.]|nr:tRNA (adenosine(37)-N6)-threonylcarbamoyltransferase complex ATPase subunit type 1 TsaE [Thiohalocapsa sp.]